MRFTQYPALTRTSLLGALLTFCLLGSAVLSAQQAPATSCAEELRLSGTARDEGGGTLVGAVVVVRRAVTNDVLETKTDDEGEFRVCLPARGRYRVEVRAAQLQPSVQFIDVASTGSSTVHAVLAVNSLRNSVTVVSASRLEELQAETPVRVEAVTREDIQRTGYERVSDVLAEIPGVVTRAGSMGGVAGQQIQGLDSRQVLVLQDGMPVIGARGIKRGIVNMNRQSVGRLESVEVVKGAGSAMYGSDAIGGVINMRTREIPDRLDINAQISGGSLGAVDGRFDIGGRYKNLWTFLNLETHRMDSYSLVPGSPITVGPQMQRNDLLYKSRWMATDRAALGVVANVYRNDEQGVNLAEGGGVASGNTIDSAQNYTLTGDFTLSPSTVLQARAYAARYDENARTVALGAALDVPAVANLNERLGRLDATISHQWGSRHYVQAGGEWNQNLYRGANRLVGDNTGQQIRTNDVWVQDRVRLNARATLTVGGRVHQHSMYGSRFVPRAGLVWGLSDRWAVRAAYSEGFRAPDLGQLFFRFANPTAFYQVIGNPNLQPENSRSYSTGVQYTSRRFTANVGVFRNQVNDLIDSFNVGFLASPGQLTGFLNEYGIPGDFRPLPGRLTFVYRNLAQIYTQGIEADTRILLPLGFRANLGYAFLDAINRQNGQQLPQRHRHQGLFRLDYLRQKDGFFASLRGAYFSRWPINPAQGTFGFGYQMWDAYTEKNLPKRLTVFGAVDNLMDSRDRKLDNPQPTFDRPDFGRTFRVGMRFRLSAEN
ncbi:MAG: TonB-dependent receptor [Bryobacterales bacterium]|jgi:outer membrane receptor for ferrienterochelin and colicins|nr:TonB-dependent receptor [Bryobacterales bacterium]